MLKTEEFLIETADRCTCLAREGRELLERLDALRNDLMAKAVELDTARQKANKKMPDLHFEGDVTRNYVAYNFQTLRDEVYMLARDGNVTKNRIGPARSSCAIHVGSYNANRESIYVQQQTISAEGPSGIAFSTNVPHTVRGAGETKLCTDCHLSQASVCRVTMGSFGPLLHSFNEQPETI